jgi:hypothetical protein
VLGGSLTIIGTGIAMGVHLTPQARLALDRADVSFHLMSDSLADEWFTGLRPDSRPLRRHYAADRERVETYEAMVDEMLAAVRGGHNVCAAFYGHPGVFATPSHDAIAQARAEGFSARMLPAISAEDCLFADLGVDPGVSGCQSYEATDFLLRRPKVDTGAALLLWQVGFVGITTAPTGPGREGWQALVDYLAEFYDPNQETVLYEASPYPIGEPVVDRIRLAELKGADLSGYATLFIPPRRNVDLSSGNAVRSARGGER